MSYVANITYKSRSFGPRFLSAYRVAADAIAELTPAMLLSLLCRMAIVAIMVAGYLTGGISLS